MTPIIWFIAMILCTIVNFAWSARQGYKHQIKFLYYGGMICGSVTAIMAGYWATQINW